MSEKIYVFLGEPDPSVEGGTGRPQKAESRGSLCMWLLKHQVSLRTLTGSSSNTPALCRKGSCCHSSDVLLRWSSSAVDGVQGLESEGSTDTDFIP